jgi:hypothetical protein
MPYAKGLIDNQFRFYVRADGMATSTSTELPAAARQLTILALYHAYSGGDDTFLLQHFAKAEALARLLAARRAAAATAFNRSDPRYGIPAGGDEGRDGVTAAAMNHDDAPRHWYASAAELYRAFTEIGRVWSQVGARAGRPDVAAHGAELARLAPLLHEDLHASLNRTVVTPSDGSARCWQLTAEAARGKAKQLSFRGFAEMLYSGALTKAQAADIYTAASGGSACGAARFLTLGSPGRGDGTASLASPSAYGFAFGLLAHDMVERFLLHYFATSAHGYTRGTFTSPESSNLADRDEPAIAYSAAGVVAAPTYLKWVLCFEEPETRTLWLAKATPRDWLAPGEAPIAASGLTTRYGRVAFSMHAVASSTDDGSHGGYAVRVNVTLPLSFASAAGAPAGGLRIRIRAPLEHAGKLRSVSVGGAAWTAFSAAEETIDISLEALAQGSQALIATGMPNIVAIFDTGAQAVPLHPARVDMSRRVAPRPPQRHTTEASAANSTTTAAAVSAAPAANQTLDPADSTPSCPDGATLVDSFELDGATWSACEDLQRPGGDIVLVPAAGGPAEAERFSKSYAPFTTNWTDDRRYYLGLGKAAVASASTDVLGAKLLRDNQALSWSAVEAAVPPIRKSGKTASGRWQSNCNGVRTFVGSRSASVDATFDDHGGDCNWEGWPNWHSYAVNMHNKAVGAPLQTYNGSISADGSVGDVLPTAIFYLPMQDNGTSVNRYWTYFAAAVPDICPTPANGCREQAVLFRFQQLQCSGPDKQPPCKLVDWPMYWNSYWFSRFPGANVSDTQRQTLLTGPANATSSSDFYSTLLSNRKWWTAELSKEGMMELALPSPAATNGSWLELQARQTLVRSMISRENTWHPRYGVMPGYGDVALDGLLSVFVATATAGQSGFHFV